MKFRHLKYRFVVEGGILHKQQMLECAFSNGAYDILPLKDFDSAEDNWKMELIETYKEQKIEYETFKCKGCGKTVTISAGSDIVCCPCEYGGKIK